jgi:hypothetical protein
MSRFITADLHTFSFLFVRSVRSGSHRIRSWSHVGDHAELAGVVVKSG